MNAPHNVREAVLVEALGDLLALMDRADALIPALEEGRKTLHQAATRLSRQVTDFESRMDTASEQMKAAMCKHMALWSEHLMAEALRVHIPALRQAAKAVLAEEIQPAIQTVQLCAQRLEASRRRRWWQWWR